MRGVFVKLVDPVYLHISIREVVAFLFWADMSVTSRIAISLRGVLFRNEHLWEKGRFIWR